MSWQNVHFQHALYHRNTFSLSPHHYCESLPGRTVSDIWSSDKLFLTRILFLSDLLSIHLTMFSIDKRSFDELLAWNEDEDEHTEAGECGGRCDGGETPPPRGTTDSKADPLESKSGRPSWRYGENRCCRNRSPDGITPPPIPGDNPFPVMLA
jgi:hypothetical protein